MSLLWPELRIALLPGRAALARPGMPPVTATRGEGWAGALAGLEQLLAGRAARGEAALTLSHHFVRLFLLPPPSAWLRRGEMQAWLGERLAEPLGGDARAWRFAWQTVPPGRPVPVCAMPAEQLQELTGCLRRHDLRLAHARPWLDLAWARRRRQLARVDGWYALLEPGQASLLHLRRGRPGLLRQRQLGQDPASEIAGMLAREALLADLPTEGDLWLERTGVNADWSRLSSGWRLHELAGPGEPELALLA